MPTRWPNSEPTPPLGRPGQPAEVAPAYVLLASADGAYITGQVIHVNGGGYMGD